MQKLKLAWEWLHSVLWFRDSCTSQEKIWSYNSYAGSGMVYLKVGYHVLIDLQTENLFPDGSTIRTYSTCSPSNYFRLLLTVSILTFADCYWADSYVVVGSKYWQEHAAAKSSQWFHLSLSNKLTRHTPDRRPTDFVCAGHLQISSCCSVINEMLTSKLLDVWPLKHRCRT